MNQRCHNEALRLATIRSAGNGSEFPSGGIEQVDIASVTKALRSDFDSVRCFHATRATEIASYYRHGIRPLTLDYWHEIVDECFTRAIVDPSVLSHLRVVRDRQFSTGQDGQVHFCCDDALLKHRDGYHLVYGSLSLLAVAIQIDKKFGTDFDPCFRAKGVPVIFVCDVPMDRIDDASLEVLALPSQRQPRRTRYRFLRELPPGPIFRSPAPWPRPQSPITTGPFRSSIWDDGHHIDEFCSRRPSPLLECGKNACAISR